jgi:hypothetical protein
MNDERFNGKLEDERKIAKRKINNGKCILLTKTMACICRNILTCG